MSPTERSTKAKDSRFPAKVGKQDDDRVLESVPVELVPVDNAGRPRSERMLHHGLVLLGSLAILSLAGLLRVRGEREVVLPVLNQPLPPICLARRLVGWDCPSCGLTRSFISLAHGDVLAAWRYNPAALLLFALVVAQIPYRCGQLWRIHHHVPEWEIARWQWAVWVLAIALLGQWIIRLKSSWSFEGW